MTQKLPLCIAIALAATVAAAQSPPPPDAPPIATTAPGSTDATLRELATRLASDNFADRAAAQKDLEKFTWRAHDLLKTFAETVDDPEAKSRLLARVQQLEEQIILDPPPISLDLKNASMNDVITALEKATGEKLSEQNQRNFGNQINLFTLTAKEKPFWQVIRDLNSQHPLQIQGYNGLTIFQQGPGMQPTVTVGGMAVFAQSITRTASVNLQPDPAAPQPTNSLSLQYMIALDPRMKVIKFQQPRFTEIRDDAGNSLLAPVAPGMQYGWNVIPQYRAWNNGQPLETPAKPGKKIASAKGEFHFVLELASEFLDVADPDKKLNVPQNFAGQTAVINQFAVKANLVEFNISRTNQIAMNNNMQDQPAVSVSFIDSAGTRIWSGSLQGGTSGTVGGNAIVPPVKVRFTIATKTKDVTIPFELKDMPLP